MANSSGMSIYEVLVQINGIGYSLMLDQNNVDSISFDYQISDVRDISSRQQAKTLSLSFPYNTHNALVFDNILSVNAASLNFDPNIYTYVTVLVDTIEVFTGYLQVTQGDINLAKETAVVNCTLISGNMEFWTLLGDGYLTDMDFSEYNHDYTAANQMASWATDYTNGYFYPLIDYGYGWTNDSISGQPTVNNQVGYVTFNSVLPSQLYPATYVKTIWDKLFLSTSTVSQIPNSNATYSTQPWQYQSDFLNSELFKNLLIPFTKGNFVQSQVASYNFTAWMANSFGSFAQSSANSTQITEQKIPINSTTPPNGYDPFGYWNNATFEYTNLTGNKINVSFQCDITIQQATHSADIYALGMAGEPNRPIFAVKREFDSNGNPDASFSTPTGGLPFPTGPNGENIWSPDPVSPSAWVDSSTFDFLTEQYNFTTYPLDNGGYSNQLPLTSASGLKYTIPFRYPLFPNERIKLVLTWQIVNNTGSLAGIDYNILANGQAPLFPATTGGNNVTNIQLVQNQLITIGQTVEYNEILPTNIKKKDFFSWILRMFNLYMEPSKTLPNTLIIEPRDVYYANGVLLDWSPSGGNKLDTSQDIIIDILSNTQDRSTAFTYKSDKDYYNSEYAQLWKQDYGYFRYIRDNDYTQSKGTIDCGFSPTPIVQIKGSTIVIPVFDKVTYQNQTTQISNTDVNIRIVQRNPSPTGFIQYSGGSPWSYAYGQITTQTGITFDPLVYIYQGSWLQTSTYKPNMIVQSPLDGNYYYNILQTNGTQYNTPTTWQFGQWYSNGYIVVYFLTGSGHNEYYQANHSNAINVPPAGPFGGQAPLQSFYWLDLGSVSPSGNPDPSLDPTHWTFFANGVLAANIKPEDGYPYVGHFDNPYIPTSDLNWSQTFKYFYSTGLITDGTQISNNLINVYYATQLVEQSDPTSKMVTCKMYLTPQDINQFYFSSKIYLEIDGEPGYYNVNSIKGFDPSQRTTCTVELLTTI